MIDFRIAGYAQKNRFLYSNNEDCPDTTIGGVVTPFASGVLLVDDLTLDLSIDAVRVPFGATKSVLRFGNVETPRIPFLNAGMDLSSFTPRVLMLDRRDVAVPVSFSGYSHNTDIPFCYFIKTGADNNLSFSDSLLAKNYEVIQSMLLKYKKVTCYVKLTTVDINELNFMVPVYLDIHTQYGQINDWFYLNVVSNFKADESTKIELIRI